MPDRTHKGPKPKDKRGGRRRKPPGQGTPLSPESAVKLRGPVKALATRPPGPLPPPIEDENGRYSPAADWETISADLQQKEMARKQAAWDARRQWYRDNYARDPQAKIPFEEDARSEFLMALEQSGSYQAASDWVGISSSTALAVRKAEPVFAFECEAALKRYQDAIVAEVRRRAIEGWDEPVYQQGSLVGVKRVFSDNLLQMLARAKVPGFNDKVEVKNSGQVGINVTAVPLASVEASLAADPEKRAALRKLLEENDSSVIDVTAVEDGTN